MRASRLLLGLGTVGLLGVGIWLGRASTASSSAPATDVRSARIEPPPIAPVRAEPQARMPVLRAHRTPATPGLTADLVDTDPRVRRAAIREAARDPDVDPALVLDAARDRDLEVGVLATHALGALYADGKVEEGDLIAIATDRALDDRVRVNALNAVALIAAPATAALLADLLARGSTLERASAAILLVHQDPELAVPALIRALSDPEQGVRANALESLRARSRGRDFGADAAAWTAWWQARPR